ncbi:metallopeptidase [Sporormia fimetaria CBS 119925]|uniref:Metallopeptidase n=1 Tax=Sporormia fimetaria CBS 119925 TaxID=1340428 RepID=A0A6A6V844_9PLEO|nr:metallopeptidase [Sporormia fimetaria CBS 119925]
MVAKDSPLLIDCPPAQGAGITSAHADINAAIAKFRMTAYMWQAMTAEDMRMKGLGRRSFRLDEEWAVDTVSRHFLDAANGDTLQSGGAMRTTAKITIVPSSRTTKEIRDLGVAQQNDRAWKPNGLFDYFKDALKEHGGAFTSSSHPIVAGLILDSHFSIEQNTILGHAALGCHDPQGLSLGIFGSHLTYAWPRFIEEVTHCLTDTRVPGDKVGNDNGECESMWEACTVGQGAFVHELGHAFGSPHRPGIMERGYSHDWPKNFVVKTAYSKCNDQDGELVTDETRNKACWHLKDALMFNALPHFRLPTDPQLPQHIQDAAPKATAIWPEDEDTGIDMEFAQKLSNTGSELRLSDMASKLKLSCPAGIVQISFNGSLEALPSIVAPIPEITFPVTTLITRFIAPNDELVTVSVVAFNGKEHKISNLWKFLTKRNTNVIRIHDSSIALRKHTTCSEKQEVDPKDDEELYEWAQLLQVKSEDGDIHRATSIHLCVGALWDGGLVHYADGSKSHWGPMMHDGYEHEFGGHATESISLPKGVTITKVEVSRGGWGRYEMGGVRMYLSDGTAAGELNNREDESDVMVIEPDEGEVVVGFCGKSEKECFQGVVEFGILTVKADIGLEGLPPQVFDMAELRNTAGLEDESQSRGKRRRVC